MTGRLRWWGAGLWAAFTLLPGGRFTTVEYTADFSGIDRIEVRTLSVDAGTGIVSAGAPASRHSSGPRASGFAPARAGMASPIAISSCTPAEPNSPNWRS